MRTRLALTVLILAGCTTTAHITTDQKQLAGIPFYVKRARCKQTTTYVQPVYVLTRVDTIGATTTRQLKIARRSDLIGNCGVADPLCKLSALQNDLNTAQTSQKYKAFNDDWKLLTTTGTLSVDHVQADDVVLAGNMTVPDLYVDYTTQYYFNTNMPWIGSSTANATLGGDATLTNAVATTENSTFTTLLSVLPVTAYLTNALKLPAAATGAASATAIGKTMTVDVIDGTEKAPTRTVILTIEPVLFQHTLSQTTEFAGRCTTMTPIPFTDEARSKYEYQWSQLTAAKDDEKKESEKKEK